jgi:hypothetical protein
LLTQNIKKPLTWQKSSKKLTSSEVKEEEIIPWAVGNCDSRSKWLDLAGAVTLLSQLNQQPEEDVPHEACYLMFDELDQVTKWKVDAGHKIRIERARRWFLNKV